MYEHKRQPLAPKIIYRKRIKRAVLYAFLFLFFCLGIGILGYKLTVPEFDWYDSLLNASMILSGMGPVVDHDIVLSKTAKVFSSFYALFSGVAFITNIGLLIAPLVHRFLHKMNIED